jgi:hypothetical protein
VVGWGNNTYGQASSPGGNDFVAVGAGSYHSLALRQDGTVVAWGDNTYGQGTTVAGNDFVKIATGAEYNLALKRDGSVTGWGRNDSGQASPPLENDFVAIAAGELHSPAIRQSCEYTLLGDINGDCRVDFYDFCEEDFDGFVELVSNWLIDCNADSENPACVPK